MYHLYVHVSVMCVKIIVIAGLKTICLLMTLVFNANEKNPVVCKHIWNIQIVLGISLLCRSVKIYVYIYL